MNYAFSALFDCSLLECNEKPLKIYHWISNKLIWKRSVLSRNFYYMGQDSHPWGARWPRNLIVIKTGLLDPLMAFDGVAASRKASPSKPLISLRVTTFPGWFLRNLSVAWEKYLFSGPMKETSNGCNLWLQWGGRLTTDTPFCLAFLINSMFLVCEAWPSRMTNAGFDGDGRTCLRKWSNHRLKESIVIHPDELQQNL